MGCKVRVSKEREGEEERVGKMKVVNVQDWEESFFRG